MGRTILGVIVGLLVGMAVNMALIQVSTLIHPMPEGLDPMADTEGMSEYVAGMPLSAFLVVLLAHAGQAFVGAMVATKIARTSKVVPGLIVGGLTMLGGIANIFMFTHPVWFAVVDLLAYMPAAYLGARLMLAPPDTERAATPA